MTILQQPKLSPSPLRSRDAVILFVDDEPQILSSLRRCFRNESYVIYTALGPKEGLLWLEMTAVDLVITDERMPEMTGTDFLREARDLSPRTSRGILTGYPSNALLARGLAAGAEAFLYKPWEDQALRNSIRSMLQKGRSGASRVGFDEDPPATSFDLGGEGG